MNFTAPLQVRQALKMLGFSDNEVRILLVLFKEKKASTMDISKKSAIGFSTAQYLLTNLANRNVIRSTGNDTYEVLAETDFSEWIDEQKKVNESVYTKAKIDIHNFLTNVVNESWRPEVLYYEGSEGIKQIYDDVIETGEDVYSWLDIEKIYPIIGDYLDTYIKKRAKKGMKSHAIMPANKANMEREHTGENREAKFKKNFDIDGEIRIYGDKVAVITFDGEKPVGFVFRGEIITRVFRAIFDSAWKS